MPERRRQLVEAGAELALDQCFQDLLTSVDTRSITGKAGVTTGSFFHHFKNRAQFTDAVLELFSELWDESTHRTTELLGAFTGEGQASVRGAATAEWSAGTEQRVLSGLQHLLWVARDQPVSEGSPLTGADLLRERHHAADAALVAAYERGLRAIRREMLPPFTVLELSVALGALVDGLELRSRVDPGSVRNDLFGDLVASLVATITRPERERAEVRDVLTEARSGARPAATARDSQGDTRGQIADAAAPLFLGRRVGEVKIAEIAEAAGVSASTVYHQFGRVSAVAAAGWARHLPELEAIAAEPLTTREGPVVRMEQVLTRYIQLARESPGALEGMVLETIAVSTGSDPGPGSAPIADLLVPHIRELRARGVLRRRIDSVSLARSATQLLAMRLLAAADDPEERIIDETLGLLLEGALARTER